MAAAHKSIKLFSTFAQVDTKLANLNFRGPRPLSHCPVVSSAGSLCENPTVNSACFPFLLIIAKMVYLNMSKIKF
jgi:hypothetical protein